VRAEPDEELQRARLRRQCAQDPSAPLAEASSWLDGAGNGRNIVSQLVGSPTFVCDPSLLAGCSTLRVLHQCATGVNGTYAHTLVGPCFAGETDHGMLGYGDAANRQRAYVVALMGLLRAGLTFASPASRGHSPARLAAPYPLPLAPCPLRLAAEKRALVKELKTKMWFLVAPKSAFFR
jgi:hypothetical protein